MLPTIQIRLFVTSYSCLQSYSLGYGAAATGETLQNVQCLVAKCAAALRAVLARVAISFAVFLREILSSLASFTVDVWILAKGMLGEIDSDSIVGQFSSAVQDTPFGSLHSTFDWFLSRAFDFVNYVGEKLTIDVSFESKR